MGVGIDIRLYEKVTNQAPMSQRFLRKKLAKAPMEQRAKVPCGATSRYQSVNELPSNQHNDQKYIPSYRFC